MEDVLIDFFSCSYCLNYRLYGLVAISSFPLYHSVKAVCTCFVSKLNTHEPSWWILVIIFVSITEIQVLHKWSVTPSPESEKESDS